MAVSAPAHAIKVREMLGKKIFNGHWNKGTLYNFDAEDKAETLCSATRTMARW